ncbi:salivary glue protein Sgs-3-like [Anopheles marshallii]|uniref:salivary glue protein Sgs-3-like n=1 Tax=Anopheles marshallii TaxID=1521116 RepID=UPI00237C11B6|nr:salivary glue protein Sgs-3-like [Anopheles marshallii]
MARYVLGLLFLVGSVQLLVALPAEKPDSEGANATVPSTAGAGTQQPATTGATPEPTAAKATPESTDSTTSVPTTQPPTTTEPPTPETTTEEPEETRPPPPVCEDPREIYDECGTACGDRTCDNQRRSNVQCSKQCVEGCFCRNGYVRDKNRKCIPAYRCGKGWW